MLGKNEKWNKKMIEKSDTHREKAPSNKTPTLYSPYSLSMNIEISMVVHQINSLHEVPKLKNISYSPFYLS